MASLLGGIEFLENLGVYRVLFPFLLIFAITYGVISKTKFFGENQTVYIIVSAVVAFVFVLSAKAVEFINVLIPFVILFLVIILFIMIVTASTGVKVDAMVNSITKGGWIVILVMLVIIILTVNTIVFPDLGEESSNGFGGIITALISPTVIGLIVLFAVFAMAAYVVTIKG